MYRPVPLCDISQVVRTGTYYIIVQVGTGRYVPVRTDMYQVYRIPDVTKTAITAQADDTLFEGMMEARRRREARVASGGPVRRHPVIRPGEELRSLGWEGW